MRKTPLTALVLLTLGAGVIFKFDGTTVTSGGANSATNNLVAVDDWAFAEPVPIANGFEITSGAGGTSNAAAAVNVTEGAAFTGVVATFSDSDPNGNLTYETYNDPNHETRVYRGWNTSTLLPTGPTELYREDRPGSYVETLTMGATPHTTSGV